MSRRAANVEAVDGLVGKYRTLVELRAGREAAEGLGETSFDAASGPLRREKMKHLARTHPGSLRELDSTSAAELGVRLKRCEAEQGRLWDDLAIEEIADPFVDCFAAYHRVLRHLLWLKLRIGAQGGRLTEESAAALRRDYQAHGPPGEHPWPVDTLGREALQRLARPPDGRLHRLVYAALDGHHGLTSREIEVLLFGRPNP